MLIRYPGYCTRSPCRSGSQARSQSSYYFGGVQGDGIFYLDPHHFCPVVPLKPLTPSSNDTIPTVLDFDAWDDECTPRRRSTSPARTFIVGDEHGYARAGPMYMNPECHARGGSLGVTSSLRTGGPLCFTL
ncbi:hypothetical protein B0H11DRAFT_2095687 [Mycena galericulata]|nr:hypothetical protein B0H11DRAFT_2095687 [Mycena galericulata]